MGFLTHIFAEDNGLKLPKSLPQGPGTSDNIATIFDIVIAVTASVAVLIIVLAGLKYITSSGDVQGVASARKAIIYATVGLAVCAAAYSIVSFTLRGV